MLSVDDESRTVQFILCEQEMTTATTMTMRNQESEQTFVCEKKALQRSHFRLCDLRDANFSEKLQNGSHKNVFSATIVGILPQKRALHTMQKTKQQNLCASSSKLRVLERAQSMILLHLPEIFDHMRTQS